MSLMSMQAPLGVPRSEAFSQITDPLIPPLNTAAVLGHLPDDLYDKRPTSHLSRLLSTLLGEVGTGQLRKHYSYTHLTQWLSTLRAADLDRFMSGVFGLKRFIREAGSTNEHGSATDAEWEAINAADASYRARVVGFMGSLPWAGTPTGMAMAASAVLGDECRIYECYEWVEIGILPPSPTRAPGPGIRREFVIQPMREISAEERHQLVRVLSRLKPVNSLLTIESTSNVFTPVPVFRAHCDSSYWHIQRRVLVPDEKAGNYQRSTPNIFIEQPRWYGSHYQGEAWDYSADVASVRASLEDADGTVLIADGNFDRYLPPSGAPIDYTPDMAMMPPIVAARSRIATDGVLSVDSMRK